MDDGGEPSPLQLFLQIVLAAQFFPETTLDETVRVLNQRFPEQHRQSVERLLLAANETLDAIDMELLKISNDFDHGRFYYILVNRAPLPAGLDRRFLSAVQAAQFKEMLDIMFSNSECKGIDVANDLPSEKFPNKADLVDKLVMSQWLEDLPPERLHSRRIFISMRCLYELRPYLVERYGGKTLHPCMGCEQWLLAGRLCTNFECNARLHERCYENYFRSRAEPVGKCTKCNSEI